MVEVRSQGRGLHQMQSARSYSPRPRKNTICVPASPLLTANPATKYQAACTAAVHLCARAVRMQCAVPLTTSQHCRRGFAVRMNRLRCSSRSVATGLTGNHESSVRLSQEYERISTWPERRGMATCDEDADGHSKATAQYLLMKLYH
jgi:hypothetical protein